MTPLVRVRFCNRSDSDRFELWSQEDIGEAISDAAVWQELDCREGLAWVQDITANIYLPQMFNLHNLGGVDFAKGCYLGQEIVARAHYRGTLKRQLHHGVSPAAIQIGTDLLREDGRNIGQVVAAAPSTATQLDSWEVLAVLQIPARVRYPCSQIMDNHWNSHRSKCQDIHDCSYSAH